ncbi:hypothetical protein CcarbDRAFT_1585 [Clostridium carboxidivorans P7]|uniref:Uncharacterized protein n=1 Tax=Clostridium carboxidivorans P7 TaxID=536227 RepID=C6PS18_9CLOT|nr:hypothetical protein [Clostridium carboxidivorans]EET87943.1 hypothetical protein CcarbDRAFT_1585 [Clostridium carboxidivorans P7]
MVNKKLMTKVIAALMVSGTLFSTVTYASAKSATATTKAKASQSAKVNHKNAGTSLKAELDKLVTAGTITADEETKILDFQKQKAAEKKAEMDKVKGMTADQKKAYFAANPKQKTDLFTELVNANIITQAKADAIKAALPQKQAKHNENKSQQGIKTQLDKLVTAGTITADEETKILDFAKQKATERKAEMDKVKGMTADQRKAYFAANPKQKTDLFAELVSANIITQAKADAIKAALPQKQSFKAQLDKLVTAGTITADQETKILDFQKQKAADMKAQMEKVKGMTADQRKAYFAANPKQKTDLFAELVSSNIITQAQADAIKAAFPQKAHK